jgi:hypothetical protein
MTRDGVGNYISFQSLYLLYFPMAWLIDWLVFNANSRSFSDGIVAIGSPL